MSRFRVPGLLLIFYIFGMISGTLIGRTYPDGFSNLIPPAVMEKHDTLKTR